MGSESDDYGYRCFFCDNELKSYFYVCSIPHVFCHLCSAMGGFCPICHTLRIFCCDLDFYESTSKGLIFEKSGGEGPVISLPEFSEESDFFFTSLGPSISSRARTLKCLDCGKLVSANHTGEHYRREHPTIPICPLTVGTCLSFKLNLSCLLSGGYLPRRVQLVKIIQHREFFQSYSSDGDHGMRILYIMASVATYFQDKPAILLWLYTHNPRLRLLYSMEARSLENNVATLVFTGEVIGPKEVSDAMNGKHKIENTGKYLCVKEPLIKVFEREGNGIVINTIVQSIE